MLFKLMKKVVPLLLLSLFSVSSSLFAGEWKTCTIKYTTTYQVPSDLFVVNAEYTANANADIWRGGNYRSYRIQACTNLFDQSLAAYKAQEEQAAQEYINNYRYDIISIATDGFEGTGSCGNEGCHFYPSQPLTPYHIKRYDETCRYDSTKESGT
jgi:hypothetical protein